MVTGLFFVGVAMIILSRALKSSRCKKVEFMGRTYKVPRNTKSITIKGHWE